MTMDLVYGRKKTISKFKVLELVARVYDYVWQRSASGHDLLAA
jgi:hypothetical protein